MDEKVGSSISKQEVQRMVGSKVPEIVDTSYGTEKPDNLDMKFEQPPQGHLENAEEARLDIEEMQKSGADYDEIAQEVKHTYGSEYLSLIPKKETLTPEVMSEVSTTVVDELATKREKEERRKQNIETQELLYSELEKDNSIENKKFLLGLLETVFPGNPDMEKIFDVVEYWINAQKDIAERERQKRVEGEKRQIAAEKMGKRDYFIRGRWESLTPEEYHNLTEDD